MRHYRKACGFSLIELLIVVLIIGIISSMSVLYLDTAHERLKSAVQLTEQMIEAVREQAIITGKPMAMRFNEQGFSFSQWNGKQWQAWEKTPFKRIKLDEDIRLLFFREQQKRPAGNKKTTDQGIGHRVYFLPTGETENFYLELSNKTPEAYRIQVSFMGERSVTRVNF